MKNPETSWRGCHLLLALVINDAVINAMAHDVGPSTPPHQPAAVPLKFLVETQGPVKPPPPSKATDPLRTSGQGFWKFVAVTESVLPLPEETRPFLKGAHGTIIVDAKRDTVYWGLEKVGWVAFSNRLSQSWVVKGDPVLASGNLHGADLLERRGRRPLVAVADNLKGEVYLSDTTFQHVQKLDWPQTAPYQNKHEFHPTDAAFVPHGELYVTDGYGKAYFMPVRINPLAYHGVFYGGKEMSQTPHGITFDPRDNSLLVSARPEGQVRRWSVAHHHWLDIQGLPPGSTVCDVDLWGDYALAPCLDGPGQTPGPIYIINRKKRAIVSTLRPKEDLGFSEARHIHDAAWYFMPQGRKKELCIIFTNWNPGGIGLLKLASRE